MIDDISELETRVQAAWVGLDVAYAWAYDNVATSPRECKIRLEDAEKVLTEAEIDLAIALGGVL